MDTKTICKKKAQIQNHNKKYAEEKLIDVEHTQALKLADLYKITNSLLTKND